MKITNSTSILYSQQVSDPKTTHKNQENSSHFGQNLKIMILTFWKKLRFDLCELQTLNYQLRMLC